MNPRIAEMSALIRRLEGELEAEMALHRLRFAYIVDKDKVRFKEEVLTHHKKLRRHWFSYLLEARPAIVLTAPIIYSMSIPFGLLDLSVSLYQRICFPVYRIPRVRRRDHLIFDRSQLGYLNGFEKFNCFFCSYGNGVLSYAREIAARTEQYWCPIKHSRRMLGEHARYGEFADYGDAAGYLTDLAASRAKLTESQ